eukprot:TRINITY_DN4449_c0_g1_i1.p1 TRINITY_DN4449_c0_g1~~TRINITY_DN4449_c0_g1_i1.p1  ORF type:complete len:366 (+),score=75.84 TRINITY_DN4449_c0_g1_i1:113-1099(+)
MGEPAFLFQDEEKTLIESYFSPVAVEMRARWKRVVTFIENQGNIGVTDLLKIPNFLWKLMVAPCGEGKERWKNWEGLLGSCWKLRNHLMCLFKVVDPNSFKPLLEGYYVLCGDNHPEDLFMRIEGDSVLRISKTQDSKTKRKDLYKLTKVHLDKYIRIEMVVSQCLFDNNKIDPRSVSPWFDEKYMRKCEIQLPVLIFKKSPPLPFPSKIICALRKVKKEEYQQMELKEKKYRQVMCGSSWGWGSKDIINSDVSLALWYMVPKDYPERNQLMFAMPDIAVSASTNILTRFQQDPLHIPDDQEEQKREMIKEMLKSFPSLSTIFKETNN